MITIRPMTPDDRSKVWQWWMRVVRKSYGDAHHRAYAKAVDEHLDDRDVEVLIGEFSDVPGEPLGFVAHRGPDLLMVFVLSEVNGIPIRRRGLGSMLVTAAMEGQDAANVKHRTAQGGKLMDAWRAGREAEAA